MSEKLSSIPRVTKPSVLKMLIKMHWRARVPLCIWGHGAIGKSQITQWTAREIAVENGWTEEDGRAYLADVRLAGYDPADLQGLPSKLELGIVRRTSFLPPDTMPIGEDASELFYDVGILFLDELNRAETQVVNVVFQLLTDRKIGRAPLLPGFGIVVAANPTIGYDVNTMDPALLKRMTHVVYVPSHPDATDEWVQWATRVGLPPEFVQFAASNADLLWESAKDDDFDKAIGFMIEPSPRTMEFAGRLLKVAKTLEEQQWALRVSVGQHAALRWEQFSPRYTLNDIISGKKPPRDLSREELLGLQPALAALGKPTAKVARNVFGFIEMVAGVREGLDSPAREIAVMMLRTLVSCNSGWYSNRFFPDSLTEFLKEILS